MAPESVPIEERSAGKVSGVPWSLSINTRGSLVDGYTVVPKYARIWPMLVHGRRCDVCA